MTDTNDTGAAGGNTGTGAPGGDKGGTPSAPWYEGKASAEIIGHLQNRISKDDDAVTAAIKMAQAHLESSRLLGVPADRIIKLPAKADDIEGWNGVYAKLGAAAKADDYKYDGLKFKDGSDLDDGFTSLMRNVSSTLHLSVEGSKQLASELVKFMDAAEDSESATKTAAAAEEKQKLATNWGKNFEANKFVASQAAQKLGFTQEEIEGLQGLVGYARIMEAFRKVGAGMGEDIFVQNGSGEGKGGIMTREQATLRLEELKADSAWVERYQAGGVKEKQEMFALQTLIHGGQKAA